MYQNLKESTDKEIAELNRIRTDLEMRLQSTIKLHDGGAEFHDTLNGELILCCMLAVAQIFRSIIDYTFSPTCSL